MRRLLGSSHGSHRKAKDKIQALRLHLHRLMESPALASPNYIEQHRDIPEEIVVEILSCLPVKSLLRFKCVSKLWQSLISDPTFTLSSSRRKHRIAIRAAPCKSIEWKHRAAIRSAPYDSIDAEEALSRGPPLLPEPMIFNNKKDDNENIEGWIGNMQILCSCNGLLLASHRTDLYLWNPTTRQCTKVLSLRTDWPSDHYLFVDPSGLCYDSYSDDYKAVFVDNGSATIVSFRRRIWNSTICSFAKMYGSGLVVNGKLHWVIRSPRLNQVAYFDPLTDEFLELPLPVVPNNGNYASIILGLGVLDGCLCMTRRLVTTLGGRGDEVGPELDFDFHPGFIGEGKHGSIEVLLMKEHGVVESWSRVFIMSDRMQSSYWSMGRSPYSVYRILMPLCFTKDGEFLLSVDGNKLLVYRPDKMSQRHIKIERHRDIFYVASYEESLASPAAYGHEEDWIVEAPDALKLLHNISGYWSDDYHGDYVDRDDYVDRKILNSTKKDSSIKEVDRSSEEEEEEEEEEDSVSKGCWKKEEDQEKFSRREKARLYYISAKEKKHKTRTRDKSKIRRVRKNERKKKRGKNLEVEDLHKQVIDFSVK